MRKSSCFWFKNSSTTRKVSKYGVISGPYLDTFHAVFVIRLWCLVCQQPSITDAGWKIHFEEGSTDSKTVSDFLNFVLFNIMWKNNSKYNFSCTFWLSNFFRAIRKYFQEVLSSKLVIVFYIKQWWLLEKAEDMDDDINFQVEKKVQSLSIFIILPTFTTNKDIHLKK